MRVKVSLAAAQHWGRLSVAPRVGARFVFSLLLALPICLFCPDALAQQQVLLISQTAWLDLIPPERAIIQQKYVVNLVEQDAFGVIIDNPGVDESSPGTTGGANLGAAVGNATYVDNANRTGNYSAKGQLAANLVGALLGSALDSKPHAQYHFRYAVRLGSGNIGYFDEVKGDPFRHPVGVCVSVPLLALIDQQVCSQTADFLRAAYIQTGGLRPGSTPPPPPSATMVQQSAPTVQSSDTVSAAPEPSQLVNCKLGTNAPVRTSASKCTAINGRQVE